MKKIVVGVDGSDGSIAALRWASEEATLRQAAGLQNREARGGGVAGSP